MNHAPLTDVATLAASVAGDERPTIIDVRWKLGGPSGRLAYAAGHLPGAVFLDLDEDLCGPPGKGGRHPLPDPGLLQEVLRAAGVRADRPVAVYDAGDGMAAARTWWTLRWAGHDRVTVLDGGYAAWVADGQPVTVDGPLIERSDFTVTPGGLPVLDAEGAARLAAEGVLIDVRVPVRFRGETEPIDPVAGRVPGAVNVPAAELSTPDGRWRAARALRDRFAEAGVVDGARVGAYCGSGVTAAHAVLALHAAGRADAALYVGSWSEWITDPDRPVATG